MAFHTEHNILATGRNGRLQAGAHYLATVRDYRGYDEQQGWRHGVVHAADMMMQLALNGALVKQDPAQLTAAGAQSPPQFFHYGEGERLAMYVLLSESKDAAQRDRARFRLWNLLSLSEPIPSSLKTG